MWFEGRDCQIGVLSSSISFDLISKCTFCLNDEIQYQNEDLFGFFGSYSRLLSLGFLFLYHFTAYYCTCNL